jgi:hypothetical protein
MKKFIFLSLAALLSVSLFLTGCPTEAEEKTVTVTADKLVYPDKVVADAAGLAAALSNAAYKVIELVPTGAVTLTVTEIPAGKTVIITNVGSGTYAVTPASGGLEIKGAVYVGSGGILVATGSAKISVTGSGVLNVNKGTLTVDVAASVHNGATPTSVTVLGTTAVINGGTLKYSATGEVNSDTKIAAALSKVASGTLDIGTSTLKPSELAVIDGIGPSKGLKVTSNTDEDSTEVLTIPPGADITAKNSDTFATITGLTVNGKLTFTAAGATLAAATAVSVGNGGVLDIGTNTGLTLAAATATGVTTTGTGKIVSAATVTGLQALLAKAGTALNIEHGAAAVLDTAATTVKAGTVLTLKASGVVTADNANTGNKKLTVTGKIVLDGGTLKTGEETIGDASHPAITITDNGRIEAGDVVISGAGALYDATSSAAKSFSITKADGFVGGAQGTIALKGATTINAGNGKVVLSVDGATDTGTFKSAQNAAGVLSVTGDTIALDNGTEIANALTIGAKGKLAVGAGGIIKVASATSTLVAEGSNTTAKLSIAQGAKISFVSDTSGTGGFTLSTGTFAKGSIGTAITATANNSGVWAAN